MYKLLSHNDLDGVGCGILARLAFKKEVKIRYNSISSLDREVESFFKHDNQETFSLYNRSLRQQGKREKTR